jgi:hypothetical protein
MLKKVVVLHLGSDIKCEVELACFETTSESDLRELALSKLRHEINKKTSSLTALSASLSLIADYEKHQLGGREF